MKKLVRFWEEQAWVDQVAEYVKPRIDKALEQTGNKQKVADFLNGVWLGHPLHPVLTDIPIGAWTTAAFFDVAAAFTGRQSKAAMTAIGLGVAAAVPTAAAGAMDWYNLNARQQRIGGGHALMNSAGLLCYILSFLMRMTGLGSGRAWSFLGLGLVGASAYIGGHLVYNERVGVRRASEEEPSETFSPAGQPSDLDNGDPHRIEVDGVPILLTRIEGQPYAVADICTHLACSLSEGKIEGKTVVCGCHGSQFSLTDGSVLRGPATQPLATYDVRMQGGRLEVRARSKV
jgi:nitrite reductase/ring-hydroxylating ferredoxin subunit/uncharacterized membrane protein